MKTGKAKFKEGYQVGMTDINGEALPTASGERILSKKEQEALGIPSPEAVLKQLKSQPKRGTPSRLDAPKVIPTRKALGMSQKDFARLIGVTASSVRNWEQGRGKPPATARKLFRIIDKRPDIIKDLAEV
ncbi:type II toxin-antitoxin system MqsA family antitoxin [Ruficoccus amylovorans]|uniref:Type II toxin-antitoxin system MqsA family antitoxin n=1 Tax=Ruficoccus amylovorans TaxID=1804625 RepID=A0A842HJK0_9BACT|nr:helix-turn-helix domain-containing protein [Ruficoccus amylovorans]MBC2595814.1 type II toxin-antitoxin system MqsA family antitoxin [Ruficoccus amylovorans]